MAWVWRKYEETIRMIKSPIDPSWKNVKYLIFDCLIHPGMFEERYKYAKSLLPTASAHGAVVPTFECFGWDHVLHFYRHLENIGAQGVMLRQPNSFHSTGRSESLLSVEKHFEGEAKVLPGGEMLLPNDLKFRLIHDHQLEPDTIITYRHVGYDLNGVPKRPSFFRHCLNKHWNEVVKEEVKYYLYTAPKNHNQPKCQGCERLLGRDENRIMVNGCYIATRANYTVSFCAKRSCVDGAFVKRKPTTTYPTFTGKIFVLPELESQIDHSEDFNWVIGEKP